MSGPVVVLAGGGTAGHVNPLLALADQLRTQIPDVQLPVLGTATGLEAELVPAAGLDLTTIERVPLPRRVTTQWLTLPGRWRRAMATTRAVVDGADVVVGFGGYVAAPAYLAARRARVPIVVHEQNARPGLANRLGARYAVRVGVTFEGTPLAGGEVVGLPLRPAISELLARRCRNPEGVRTEAARALGLSPDAPTIVVTGGSLGALRLNQMVPRLARPLLRAGAQVLHLTGRDKDAAVREQVAATLADEDPGRYQVRDYLVEMEQALACADLVIARAGAGTVSELTALGIPAIYVPLPIGNGEQARNAAPAVAAGAALMVSDRDFDQQWLATQVLPLIQDDRALGPMRTAAAAAGITDGAQRLAVLVTDVLDQSR